MNSKEMKTEDFGASHCYMPYGFNYPENSVSLDVSIDGTLDKLVDLNGNGFLESKDSNTDIDTTNISGHINT